MKKYVLLGMIALVMMLLTMPVMAADSAASVQVSGGITQQLSISTDTTSVAFGQFTVGDNRVDQGTITVTSAFVPHWTVTASMSDGYGFMRLPATGTPPYATPLTNPLKQYNYLAISPASPDWVNVQGMKFGGSASTTMTQTYMQTVLVSDQPGTYGSTITYTIAAS